MTPPTRLRAPLDEADILALRAGDAVQVDGVVYGARDAAHARMIELLERGDSLPFDPAGQIVYYVGPAPARPGEAVGSAGPTTSGRMDRYTPALYAAGLRATIGKGYRSPAVREAIQRHRGLYLAAAGGSGALLSRRIVRAEIVAWPELGAEALYRFEFEAFPAIVVDDAHGTDLYEAARQQFRLDR